MFSEKISRMSATRQIIFIVIILTVVYWLSFQFLQFQLGPDYDRTMFQGTNEDFALGLMAWAIGFFAPPIFLSLLLAQHFLKRSTFGLLVFSIIVNTLWLAGATWLAQPYAKTTISLLQSFYGWMTLPHIIIAGPVSALVFYLIKILTNRFTHTKTS